MWNDLDNQTRESESLAEFKRILKQRFKPPEVPLYFLTGDRFSQVHHARIRNKCSNLNADLSNNHLTANASCRCGSPYEDAEHFFFRCPEYRDQRRQLFINTRSVHPLSVKKLLFGIETLNNNQNSHLFEEVQRYIKRTKRFDM